MVTSSKCGYISKQNTNRADIQFEIIRLLGASTAKSTGEAYDRSLTLFATFRSEFQLQSPWPPSLYQVVQFETYMSVKELVCPREMLRLCTRQQKRGGSADAFVSARGKQGGFPIKLNILNRMYEIYAVSCNQGSVYNVKQSG